MASSTKRTPEEIRASIEENRIALGESLGKLREEVTELTDWRSQIRANQETLILVAAGTGFVLAGGIGGTLGLVTGRKRRKVAKIQRKASRMQAQVGRAEKRAAKLSRKVRA